MDEKFRKNANPQDAIQSGKKPNMVLKVIFLVILSVLFLSPVDLVPSIIVPVVGWVDDIAYLAGILGTVISMISGKKNQQIPGASGSQAYMPPMYNEVKSNKKK